MTFLVKDRVKDTTTTTGTGTLTLSGTAPTGFKNFTSIGDGNETTYYVGTGADWEVRTGVVGSSGTTLTRGTLLDSSTGSAVSFSAGSKDVFVTVPAGLVGWQQIGSTINTTSGTSVSFTSIPATYSDLLFVLEGVSANGAANLTIELSDNGANWTSPITILALAASADTAYGTVVIPGYLKPAGQFQYGVANLTADRSVATGASQRAWRIAAGINAARFAVSAGAFDAGTIKLFGRL